MANQVKIQIEAKANLAAIDEAIAKLKALKDKKIKVDIDVDNAAMRKLDNIRDRRIKVDLDVNDSRVTALRDRRVKVTVDVDSSSLTALQSRLASLRNQTVNVRVRATDDRINERARNLIRNRTANINVAVSGLAAAEAAIAAVARNRTARIRLDVDAGAAAALTQILNALTGAGGAAGNANRIAGGMSSMGGSAARMGPALLALTPFLGVLASGAIGAGVYGVAGALGAVTAAAGGISAGVTAGLAAIPIAAAATSQKVKDHFSFMKDDVVNTMKEIAVPVQQPLVNLATALGAAFHQMRPNLEAITQGTANLVDHLSAKLPAIADKLGPALQKAFEAGVPHVKNLIDSLPRLTESFGNFMQSLGSPEVVEGAKRIFESMPGWIEGAGRGVEKLAAGFNNVMGFLDSGKMDGFGEGIGKFMDKLGNTDWSGVTDGLAQAGNAFGDFMANIDTQNMADNIAGFAEGMASLTNAATEIVSGFQTADAAVRTFSDNLNNDIESRWGEGGLGKKIFGDGWDPNRWLNDHAGWLGDFEESIPEVEVAVKVKPPEKNFEDPGFPPIEVPMQLKPSTETPSLPPIPIVGELQPVQPPTGMILPLIGEFQGPPEVPAPAPVPLTGVMPDFVAPTIPPVELTAGPIPAPAPPPPVPVDIVVADGQVTVPPPPPVPVTFDVTQPTLNLTVPPVPITFDVALPQITIPPVTANATVTVTSNVAEVAAQINALSAGTASFHTVSSNVGSVAAEIQSLNGQNTSSTHTVNFVKTGDTGEGAPR
ncbi:hypothetical protein RhoFasSB10_02315 [Rhodococcus fascians]|uniref:hypothetical protein n=1 Tax=Rhodococcoides fascians TaxID=1828 RepID=UPI001427C507|nr:hypothetical protein [Rhodococcus fascians]